MHQSWTRRSTSGLRASTAQAGVEQPELGGRGNKLTPEISSSTHNEKHYGLDFPDTRQLGNGRRLSIAIHGTN